MGGENRRRDTTTCPMTDTFKLTLCQVVTHLPVLLHPELTEKSIIPVCKPDGTNYAKAMERKQNVKLRTGKGSPMKKNQHALLGLALLLCGGVVLAGCAATPVRPDTQGVVFQSPTDVVQQAAVDALVVTGFDIKKSEPLYVEGFRPRKVGLFVGSGGETAGVWLEPLEAARTRVRVDTAKTVLGIAGQKNWDTAILEEMEKSLGKRE
jgi:hypothetical protein